MFEKFTATTVGDFRQRYEGTYGLFKRGKDSLLVCLTRVRGPSDTNEPFVEFKDSKGVTFKVNITEENSDIGFEFLPPKSAYYNIEGGTPWLLKRIPAKQYSRGICGKNTSIRNGRGANLSVDFDSLISIFERAVSPEKAYNPADITDTTGTKGVAISPAFAFFWAQKTIMCYEKTIGTIDLVDGELVITLADLPMWGVEVKDALRRANIRGKVIGDE
jgi:hypothetical protein